MTTGADALKLVRETLERLDIPFEQPSEAVLRVADLEGQTFSLELSDDGNEASLLAEGTGWHWHFDQVTDAHNAFLNLLDGQMQIVTSFRGDKFCSAELTKPGSEWRGYSIRVLANPFKSLTTRVFSNQVDLT